MALTQYLIQYRVIVPALASKGLVSSLSDIQFSMLVLATLCVTAAGNVINDIFDIEIDKINRSETQIVGKEISSKSAYVIYFSLIAIGLGLSLLLAIQTHRVGLLFIFPLCIFLLHYYSKTWKSKGLIGNIIVSSFVAFVTGILLIPDYDKLVLISNNSYQFPVIYLISGYIFFSFFTNLLREIIKDMEDVNGDTQLNYQTFPIAYGMKKAKALSSILVLILMIGIGLWVIRFHTFFLDRPSGYLILLIIPFFIYVLYQLRIATNSEMYHHISSTIKLIMIFGLAYLLIG